MSSLSLPEGVAETADTLPCRVPEKLACCLWYDARWRPTVLRTLDGGLLTVHSPGRWNRHAGPDFRQAVITFDDGVRRRGDVEIHRFASGWTNHRHHLDTRYNEVILHVFLWNDRAATEVRRADGQTIPQVALAEWLPHSLAVYQAAIPLEDYPHQHVPRVSRCYTILQALPSQDVQQCLNHAGDRRLQQRMRRWASRAEAGGLQQAMYEAVLRSLGSVSYSHHFQALAQGVPWTEVHACLHGLSTCTRRIAAEALLLGLAGILQQAARHTTTMDTTTQLYIAELQHYWRRFPTSVRQRAREGILWRHPHVRPAHTPERRLAGMAQVLARHHDTDLLQAAVARCQAVTGKTDRRAARSLCNALTGLFVTSELSYWSHCSHFVGRRGRVQRLIGRQRALTVVIDAVVPVLLLYAHQSGAAELRDALLACYHAAPRLPDNTLLRDMTRRLLGDDPALRALVAGARQQQGLLQVFDEFCRHDEEECQACTFSILPDAWETDATSLSDDHGWT